MLVAASITDALVTFATHVIRDLGVPGVFLLVMADAMGIPIAAGAIMLFAGFNVSEGHSTLLAYVLAGIAGDVVGASLAWLIGYRGRRELIERHGAKVHISPERLAVVEGWFERFGDPVIFLGRIVPFVRTYVSFVAGVARMAYVRFVVLTFLGAIPLTVGFGVAGRQLGSRWTRWRDNLHYVDYVVVALVVGAAAWFILRRRRAADVAA